MRVFVTKKFVHRYIERNWKDKEEEEFRKKLFWYIVNLSHRVSKSHGRRGHNKRQNIRRILMAYARNDIKQYQPTWTLKRPTFLGRIFLFVKRLFKS